MRPTEPDAPTTAARRDVAPVAAELGRVGGRVAGRMADKAVEDSFEGLTKGAA